MKRPLSLCLILSIILCAAPQTLRADTAAGIFSLPDGRVGEAYQANIEAVLRGRYRLKIETGVRESILHWSLLEGDLPPGLSVHTDGVVFGTPRTYREQPYQFRVRVVDQSVNGSEPLFIPLSIVVAAPRLRLTSIAGPALVPLDRSSHPKSATSAAASDDSATEQDVASARAAAVSAPAAAQGSDIERPPAPAENANGPVEASVPYTHAPVGRSVGAREVAQPSLGVSVPYFPVSAGGPASVGYHDGAGNAAEPAPIQGGPCAAPTPSPTPGAGVFYLDARNGNLTEAGKPVTPRRRFRKNEQVTVVVVNKNPYLYTYKYSSTATLVVESALNTFVPFVVGNLGDLGAAPKPASTPDTSKPPDRHGLTAAVTTPDCSAAAEKITNLVNDGNAVSTHNDNIKTHLDDQKMKSDALANAYNAARVALYSPNQTISDLYCNSTALVNAVNAGTGVGGINSTVLDGIGNEIDVLEREANRLISRRDAVREAHASCLDQPDASGKLLGEYLREAGERADEILANVKQYREVLNKIKQDLDNSLKGRQAAQTVLNDPNAFFETHAEGNFEASNDVEIKLEVTPKQGVAEAQPVQGNPFVTNFTFGGAPFFSISGGLIFSPLRKREFVRVQGFERDQQGALVLKDGKPNLTTVVGLNENSPTRITPAIFLHGRLSDRLNSFVDGVHMTLGITAKNDNKGTDVEFLVGPSISFLDGNMFLTAGGYAGRQQKLGGSLFEGFAVPSGVDELPIEKNYRWSFGFSISYRLPINKPKSSQ